MKLKSLELVGFKSFMNPISVFFNQPITAVVGPNGCGKSNLVDAIFWVLGDQSPKHLRGGQMQDVLCNGTEKYPSLGMAEVSLTLTNEDGKMPAAYNSYSEITVTRRLFRSGEGEYLINKQKCRLKDIHELFMDTGLGGRGYSIVEQGQVGRIVSCPPEERRLLIEEAAGITKYKSRRKEAQKKMEVTQQNLAQLDLIVHEIQNQLQVLKRQVGKAERYKQKKDGLKQHEIQQAHRELLRIQNQDGEVKKRMTELTQKIQELRTQSEVLELSREQVRLDSLEFSKAIEALQDNVFQQSQEFQNLIKNKELFEAELKSLEQMLTGSEGERGKLHDKKDLAERNLNRLTVSLSEFEVEKLALEKKVQDSEKSLSQLEIALQDLEAAIEKAKEELVDLMARSSETAHKIESAEEMKDQIQTQKKKFMGKIEETQGQFEVAQERLEQLRQLLQESEKKKGIIQQEQETLARQLAEGHNKCVGLKRKMDDIKTQIHETRSRLETYEELAARAGGTPKEIQQYLTSCDFKASFTGYVFDFVEVEAGMERAVESCLGDILNGLIWERAEEVHQALLLLQKGNKKGGVFLALNWGKSLVQEQIPLLPSGTLGLLTKFIRIKPEAAPVLKSLFEAYVVVPDLTHAFNLRTSEKLKNYTLITPLGELLRPDGVCRGQAAEGVLVHRRETALLQTSLVQLETEYAQAERDVQESEKTLTHFEGKKGDYQESLRKMDLELLEKQKELEHLTGEHQRTQEELESLEYELDQSRDAEEELQDQLANLNQERQWIEKGRKEKEIALKSLTQRNQELQSQFKELQTTLTNLRVTFAGKTEKLKALEQEMASEQKQLQEILEGISSEENKQQGREGRKTFLKEEIQTLEKKIVSQSSQVEQGKEELTVKRQKLQLMESKKTEGEGKLREFRDVLQQLEQQLHQCEVVMTEARVKRDNWLVQIREKYAIDLTSYTTEPADISDEELAKQVEQLRQQLQNMGDVNLLAIEEHQEQANRLQFLEKQRTDLQASLESLRKTILKMNRISRARFEETFNQVNIYFQRLMPVLFGGGKGELSLTENEDLLEAGMDIIVRPPGKKLQNIQLLSGGEKALTAVGLIFSLFLLKPSPFCLLDEVDAPLDEVNVGRFNEMVRKFTDRSQFIIVTHNKRTMELADILYGVTMDEPGVSRVLSIQLDKAIQLAQQKKKETSAPSKDVQTPMFS